MRTTKEPHAATDRRNIERMATWRYPRGSLSREMLALMERVEALEADVRNLREQLLP